MIEQYYAVHKSTGEVYEHKGRYVFSEKGLIQSIRNDLGTWKWSYNAGRTKSTLLDKPELDFDIKKVTLS
jgi:hypothetical protein